MTYAMTRRQARWLATLYRHRARDPSFAVPPWQLARRRGVMAACLLLLVHPAGHAATLRDFTSLGSANVRLSDLFANLGAAPDRILGPSPAPGQTITVQAPQLAAIARDYAVDWRPETGAEHVTLERGGTRLAQDIVLQAVRTALVNMGAPPDAEISMPGFEAPLMPAGSVARTTVSETNYDPTNGRFSAVLNVAASGADTAMMRLSGQVAAMQDAAVLTHHLRPGTVLAADDLRSARVRMSLLHGNVPISVASALGQALRHDLPPGQPLTGGDVAKPVLVTRNSAVRMLLDAGDISVAGQGVALEDGGLGETMRVQNPNSKVVVMAIVTAPGEVHVVPGRAALQVATQ